MKPPFAYYGGKTRMADRIVGMMPPHRVYIEPFAGSLAVLFAKDPSRHEVVNDLDDGVVTFFKMLRDQPEDLERVCRLTPMARSEFTAADIGAEGIADLEKARRFWVRISQSFSQVASSSTGWSVTTARTQSKGASVQGRIDRFAACAERLSCVQIENCDAADLVRRLATPDAVIYADPPYLHSVRRSGRVSNRYSDYRADMGDDDAHRNLAAALHETPATVLLSGYPSPLYEELYADWEHIDATMIAHSSNARTSERTRRTERIWSNRSITQPLRLEGIS